MPCTSLSCSSRAFLRDSSSFFLPSASPAFHPILTPLYEIVPSIVGSQKKPDTSWGSGGAAALRASWMRDMSAMTRAHMVSMMGMARITTQGSCLPFASRVQLLPVKSAVGCALPMVAGGLKAMRSTIFIPLEMPPCTPPLWLVMVTIFPSLMSNISLCADPRIRVPENPDPISNPLVAGIDIMACASLASSLSKHGSPRPMGQLRITMAHVPPTESSSARAALMQSAILSAVGMCGQRTMCWSTSSREMVSRFTSLSGSTMSPTELTHDTSSVLYLSFSHFSAIAPAATRPMVSRALARPPPLAARKPYFI
mmetsp:Transcript_6980/g.15954  ORF Transcript_6980/g.15954 Transcript_6980/m.15954 type:complete len:312 (+) Transcript_6980:265-1200(+)